MADHRLFEHFERRLGEEVTAENDIAFVEQTLTDSEAAVMNYIGRKAVPAMLDNAVVELTIIAWNKRGAEGESSRSEGGISRSFEDLPPLLKEQLKNFPRKAGVIYAAVKA